MVQNELLYNFSADHKKWCVLYLIIIPLLIYWPVVYYPFIDFDDGAYITDNPFVRNGITWDGVVWAFTKTHAGNWHPLTWISHMIDCSLFGLNAGKHHGVNLIIHILNGVLLFFICLKMTENIFISWVIAAFFAVHPMNVESVAWISERKNLVSTLFWMLTLWTYTIYVQRSDKKYLIYAFCFFAVGLMAKPMLVTLPFVLLLLDYYPLKRLDHAGRIQNTISLFKEKIPFFALTVISCIITIKAQESGGALASISAHSFQDRIFNSLTSYVAYIIKMFFPTKLAILYPYPKNFLIHHVIFATFILGIISFLTFMKRKKYPFVMTGWFWYIGTLVPVIGLVQVGHQSMADRYAYIPFIGLFFMLSHGISLIIHKLATIKHVLILLCFIWISGYIPVSIFQVKKWENSISLFNHALEVTTNNYVIHKNIANTLISQGKIDEAMEHLTEAIKISPTYADAYNSMGIALNLKGKPDEAINYFEHAIQIKPDYAEPLVNIGDIYLHHNHIETAIQFYKRALIKDPKNAKAHNNIGVSLAKIGKLDEAIDHFQIALELQPDDKAAQQNIQLAKEKIRQQHHLDTQLFHDK